MTALPNSKESSRKLVSNCLHQGEEGGAGAEVRVGEHAGRARPEEENEGVEGGSRFKFVLKLVT